MPAELAKLRAEPARFRDHVLLVDKAREATLAFYRAQIVALTAQPRLEYAQAQAKLNELKQLLPDSSAVQTMAQSLSKNASVELRADGASRSGGAASGADQGPGR